jgi:hypothetical protein
MNMINIDWRNVRMLTIEGTTVSLVIGDSQQDFTFESAAELSEALRRWASEEDRVLQLLETDQQQRHKLGI